MPTPDESPEYYETWQEKFEANKWIILFVVTLFTFFGTLTVMAIVQEIQRNNIQQEQTTTINKQERTPDLLGLSLSQAEEILRQENLKFGEIEYVTSTKKDGTIIQQLPAPGDELNTERVISVTLSVYTEIGTIPNVTGLPEKTAKSILTDLGYTNITVNRIDNEAPQNTIIRQSPYPGSGIPLNQKINLFVSTGKALLPNTVGLTAKDAVLLLGNIGFIADLIGDRNSIVTRQSPKPGKTYPYGTVVRLYTEENPLPSPTTSPTAPTEPTQAPVEPTEPTQTPSPESTTPATPAEPTAPVEPTQTPSSEPSQ